MFPKERKNCSLKSKFLRIILWSDSQRTQLKGSSVKRLYDNFFENETAVPSCSF